ncbi:hypothetical protein KEM48_009465 [Puccinia striiformis f. sp. tritici PST-130]|nr:hypothetical protein KEM48_009465 [Puccinia striiformis f. sp. tritici PST-130]
MVNRKLKLKPTEKLSILTVCNRIISHIRIWNCIGSARLTSLELQTLSIPSTMVCDSAVGWLINSVLKPVLISIKLLITKTTHRIASNGDTANKISTYQISLICKYEERSSLEACTVRGKVISEGSLQENVADDGQVNVATVLVTPQNTLALNPAFDVTPANLIDAISTEVGVIVKDSGNNQFDLRTYFT